MLYCSTMRAAATCAPVDAPVGNGTTTPASRVAELAERHRLELAALAAQE
jgi:hypothetical protein